MSATAARSRGFAVPIVALSVVGLAACSSGGSTGRSSSAPGSADGTGEPAGMAAFRQCMTEHGVTRPARTGGAGGGSREHAGGPGGVHRDPAIAPPGVDQNTWTTARAACAGLAPTPPAAPGN
jgi:hypothetical protein